MSVCGVCYQLSRRFLKKLEAFPFKNRNCFSRRLWLTTRCFETTLSRQSRVSFGGAYNLKEKMGEGLQINGIINGKAEIRSASVLSQIDEFCFSLGGSKPIHSILIANNGMAAVKFMRSVRSWSYETFGTDQAILLVAMATPEDMRINAEHIRMADQFVEVPGGTNNNNYANVQLITEIAETTGVSAVWPGWGHASENPELPDSLSSKGIIFLGPPAAPMAALGDKIGSSLIAQAAGVPTLPWSGSNVKIPPECCSVSIPDELYKAACVFTTEEAIRSCQTVGYPAMIKASWGGGGKGIRKVRNDDEVRALFKQVQGEVPGSPIFIMKVASQSRHLEVQLLCDQHRNVAALHSRDCSVQRRHQKIIEEGPITVAPPETVAQLEQGARRLAKCVNYVGAATVEYLYSMDSGEYYFLELNPRLQVEHPVTEWIAEVNLPAAQLVIGMGVPLWRIPEIRRFYGKEGGGGYDAWQKTSTIATPFDFDMAKSVKPKGHCVAVRVTSEDPDDGFKPTSGKVQELSFKSKPNVWAYFSIKSGGGIHEFSDSQFGHVFAFGESRALAIANMVLGLKEIQIRGEIHTNVDYTVDLLHAQEYRDNKIHTGWLDSRIAMHVRAQRPPWYLSVVGGALYKASSMSAARVSEYIGYLEKGQIPPKNISLVNSMVSLNIEGSKYTVELIRGGPGSYRLKLNESEIEAEIHTLRDGGLLMQLGGNSHVIYAQEEAAGTRLLIDGRTCLLQNDHDPSKLSAETPCKLLRFLVPDGSHVDTDVPYAEVEVMKMCMPLLSPAAGTIHHKMNEGQAMQAGDVIAALDLDDPSAVRKAAPFHGNFPVLGPPTAVAGKVHQRCAASMNAARMILAGYEHDTDNVVQSLLNCLDDPQLPLLQWQESMAVLATRLPKDLKAQLDAKFKEYEASYVNSPRNVEFPAKALRATLEEFLCHCSEKERVACERLIEPLISLVKSYEGGRESHARIIIQSLFEEYLRVEEPFSQNTQADVIEGLRLQHKKDLLKVLDIVLSHQGVKRKNKLILRLMEALVYPNPAPYREQLVRFSALGHPNYAELVSKAGQLLEQTKLSDLRASIARSLSELEMFTEEGERISTPRRKMAIDERMEDLVNAPVAVEDALVSLFDHSDHTLQRRVVETYVRRLYQPYLVKESVRMQWHRAGLIATWQFLEESISQKSLSSAVSDKIFDKTKKWGSMVILKSLQFLPTAVNAALKEITHALQSTNGPTSDGTVCTAGFGNMLHLALVGMNNPMNLLQDSGDEDQAQQRINKLVKALKEESLGSSLRDAGIGMINCIIQRDDGRGPMRHCFNWSSRNQCFEEEPLLRHLQPPLSNLLELDKLKGYKDMQYASSRDRQWHMYAVIDKPAIQRMFLRTLLRQPKYVERDMSMSVTESSIVKSLQGVLEELELCAHNANIKSDHVHVFICILRAQQAVDLSSYTRKLEENCDNEDVIADFLQNMAYQVHDILGVQMHRLAVGEWEIRLKLDLMGAASGAWRIVVSNPTGYTCTARIYKEIQDENKQDIVYRSCSSSCGPLDGVPVSAQYHPLNVVDRKRLIARRNNTTYCYDFPLVFEKALRHQWASNVQNADCKQITKFNVSELIFSENEGAWGTPVVTVDRDVASNNIGMVAWYMEMSTPEFPNGRTVLVVANDVTHNAGSFGPKEDAFFAAVTDLACKKKLPLIYLAANSGARIGVAEEVRARFQVGWYDEQSPDCGFQYLYLNPEDYATVGSSVLAHEVKLESGEVRWIIDDIIGKEEGLGVENLSGSGAIAGAYSRAYQETFTLTFVTGRTVGIGAYLARLGMRCIQRLDQPIILTGYSALNKLLGREVYSSHMQLGGPKIMATNGVVHLTVSDDLEGVLAILKWLSYIPPYIGGPLPIMKSLDPPERLVEYMPEKLCDPREAIRGQECNGKWLGGLFDKDSFTETLEGWAQTVVTGRAKLGGIPVGIIAVETQTVMQVIPADPGQLDSAERVVPQAGQVWFPDSASKTSQALMDFNKEELPLFILANWRGFSGGQRDLFEGILQAGSAIVENLRTYKQPVFVYIPKTGELRGGAWVVVDSKINPDEVEMYAETSARGGVLEPEGMIEIKFRTKELLECMHRLDKKLISLKNQLHKGRDGNIMDVEGIQEQIKNREKQLLPVYKQIAIRFAELHDTSFRMAAKGVIKKVVNWEESRSFFYNRLNRRLAESTLIKKIVDSTGGSLSHRSAELLLKEWFVSSKTDVTSDDLWKDDAAFLAWKNDPSNYETKLKQLRIQKVFTQLLEVANSVEDLDVLPKALATLVEKVDPSVKSDLVGMLKDIINSL